MQTAAHALICNLHNFLLTFFYDICMFYESYTHSYVLPYIWKYLNVSSSPNELSSETLEFKDLMKKNYQQCSMDIRLGGIQDIIT